MPDLVSSAVLEGIAGLIEQAGRDPADMAQRVGISAAALYNPDVLISPYRVNDLLELAATECEDRSLGLKIANVQGFDIMGGVWLMARHEFFGHRVFFNQDLNAIHVSNEDHEQPNYRNPDGVISNNAIEKNRRQLEATLGRSGSFIRRVSRIIRLLVNDQGCTANEVANILNLPQRTLRYRLKQNNTGYQTLYDTARQDIAKNYLINSDLSISAIAERLHFTDTAAFSNFFKRGAGMSPRVYAKVMQLPGK
jgi:AraC-like DNA-binding protein